MPLRVHEPLLWFQSITHSLHQHYKCQGMPTAMPKAPVGSSSTSCFCQASQCVGMNATLPTMLYCCVNVSRVCLYCCNVCVQPAATRQWHTIVLSGFKSLLVLPVPTTCDYSFSFPCQQAGCMNGEMHK